MDSDERLMNDVLQAQGFNQTVVKAGEEIKFSRIEIPNGEVMYSIEGEAKTGVVLTAEEMQAIVTSFLFMSVPDNAIVS